MRGAVRPLPQYVFMVWCLIKQWIRVHGMVLIQYKSNFSSFYRINTGSGNRPASCPVGAMG
jgi:hypothetical protein